MRSMLPFRLLPHSDADLYACSAHAGYTVRSLMTEDDNDEPSDSEFARDDGH